MSLKSWKKEFYSPISRCSKANALEHSIKKWEGALPENLEKHGCEYSEYEVTYEDQGIYFGIESCALCEKYYEMFSNCEKCPVVIYGGLRCDSAAYNNEGYFYSVNDPKPMLNLLYRVKALLDADKS